MIESDKRAASPEKKEFIKLGEFVSWEEISLNFK